MAFDNVTFFEVHLPSDRFGGEPTDETTEYEAEIQSTAEEESGSSGPSVGRIIVATILLAAMAYGVRRFRSGGEDEEIEMEYEGPGVEVEAES